MKGTYMLAVNEFKLNLRDPMMLFWTLAFPTIWLVLMAAIIPPIPGFAYAGLNNASLFLSAAISLSILNSAFVGVPQTLTTYRETGVLKRLRATPVKSIALIISFCSSQFAFMTLGVGLLLVIGKLFFDIQILGLWMTFAGIIFLGMFTFLIIGSAIGSIARSFRTASVIIWSAFTPMLMLSGLFMPINILPSWVQPIAKALPLTPLNTMLRDIVYGVPFSDSWGIAVLGAWIVASFIIISKFFRWE